MGMPVEAPTPAPVASSLSPSHSPTQTSPAQACANSAHGQCGGVSFSGSVCCPDGYYCKFLSDYWSQCYSCQYFPDPACGASLLGGGSKLKRRTIKAISVPPMVLIQERAVLEHDKPIQEPGSDEL